MAGLPKLNLMMLGAKRQFSIISRLLILFCGVILAFVQIAAAGAGTTAAEFLKVNVGGKASSMCGAYTAVSGDVYASQYNPAGLAKLEKKELAVMHNEWMIDTRYDFAAFGLPLNNSVVSLAVRYFDMGSFTGRDSMGSKTSDFKANDQSINISYAKDLNSALSFGASLMYIKETIASKTSQGFAADFGINAILISDVFTVGCVAKNIGPKMSAFEDEEEDLPTTYNIGAAITPGDGRMMVTTDVVMAKNEAGYIAIGSDYSLFEMVHLRAGVNFGSEREEALNWCAGLGFNVWNYSLDYSFEPVNDLDNAHRISMSMKF